MLFQSVYSSFIKIPQNHKNSLNRAGVHTKPKVGVHSTMGHILSDVLVHICLIPRLVFYPSCTCYHFTSSCITFYKSVKLWRLAFAYVLHWCKHQLGVLLFTIIACCIIHGVTALHVSNDAWHRPYSPGTNSAFVWATCLFRWWGMATLATLLLISIKRRPFWEQTK